jgi:hypothetical protein
MRRLPLRARPWLFAAALAAGCGPTTETSTGDDSGGTDDGDGEAGDAESDDAGAEAGDAGDDAGDDTGTDGGDTGVTDEDLARGIRITRVDYNSGAAVPIAIDGREPTYQERYTRIPENRLFYVFVEVDVDDDWTPRELEARFRLHRPSGEIIEAAQRRLISRDTADWQEDNGEGGGRDSIIEVADYEGFFMGIPAEEAVNGLYYSLSVHEVDPAFLDTPEPTEPPVIPPASSGEDSWPVGVESSENVMRLVMVPIHMNYGGCDAVPESDDANMARYRDHLFSSNPVERVDWITHEPLEWNAPIANGNDLGAILGALSDLKQAEGEAPETYYYALINNCGQCVFGAGQGGCIAGMARLPGDSADTSDSLQRVGSGIGSTSTFVHEIGHAQGRSHVECEGAGAAGTDPTYPHYNGTLGSWGFDLRDLFLFNPNASFDYMSYCGPSWVSNWQWEATYDRIETLSSFSGGGATPPPDTGPILFVNLDEQGEVDRSWTTDGWLSDDRDGTATVDFMAGSVVVATTTAKLTETVHSTAKVVAVEMPSERAAITDVVVRVGETRVAFPADRITDR